MNNSVAASKGKRGRPRKTIPTTVAECTSLRDYARVLGVDRKELTRWKLIASIPEEEFERLVEADEPATVSSLVLVARRRAGKHTERVRRCPHCQMPLRIEDAG